MTTLETQQKALELLESIDGELLGKQRAYLLDLILREDENTPEEEKDAREGLIALIDALADFLADVLGDNSALFN